MKLNKIPKKVVNKIKIKSKVNFEKIENESQINLKKFAL